MSPTCHLEGLGEAVDEEEAGEGSAGSRHVAGDALRPTLLLLHAQPHSARRDPGDIGGTSGGHRGDEKPWMWGRASQGTASATGMGTGGDTQGTPNAMGMGTAGTPMGTNPCLGDRREHPWG